MENKEHIKVNNKITIESMKNRMDKGFIKNVLVRYNDEFAMLKNFISISDKILDMGCKDGIWFDLLKENGYNNLVGVDCCDEAVNIVKSKGYDAHKADIQYLKQFKNESFNVITCIHTLEHVPNIFFVMEECYRLLKKDGIVFIEIPTQEQEDATKWGHYNCFSNKREIIALFKGKFELLNYDTMNPPSKKPWHRFVYIKK